jgi:hypothetical protein
MNRRQKAILTDIIAVVIVTAVAIVVMIELRNWLNRSEATRAMEHLGRVVSTYRKDHGAVPPESYVLDIKKSLPGQIRLGGLYYRARWIEFESGPDEILAYTRMGYQSLFQGRKFIVLRLDGRVEQMKADQLQVLLDQQQGPMEKADLKKR